MKVADGIAPDTTGEFANGSLWSCTEHDSQLFTQLLLDAVADVGITRTESLHDS